MMLRKRTGMLMKRDWDKAINSSHLSNHTFHLETPDWMIFGDKAAILNPEVTEGPYCKSYSSARFCAQTLIVYQTSRVRRSARMSATRSQV